MPEDFRRRCALDAPADERLIKFIGVWDTVDAVGLPVDELSTMVDRLFYPHRFPDQDLSRQVERACHAIAIDDERYTFHPVLWKRVRRGGFRAHRAGLVREHALRRRRRLPPTTISRRFRSLDDREGSLRGGARRRAAVRPGAAARDRAAGAADRQDVLDPAGKFGVYYRYNPRDVWKLCHDADNRVEIDEPKIHHAVFKRIANNTAGYAPPGLPTSYRLVDPEGRISELTPDLRDRVWPRAPRRLLSRARDHVFWRRVLYYGFVVVTLALLAMPYYRPPNLGAVPESIIEAALAKTLGLAPPCCPVFSAPGPATGPRAGPSRQICFWRSPSCTASCIGTVGRSMGTSGV